MGKCCNSQMSVIRITDFKGITNCFCNNLTNRTLIKAIKNGMPFKIISAD